MASKTEVESRIDVVTLFSSLLLLIAFLMPRFMAFKANRISVSQGLPASALYGKFYFCVFIVICIFFVLAFIKKNDRIWNFITGLFAGLMLAGLIYSVAVLCNTLPEMTGTARLSFSFGFLIAVIALYGIMVVCGQKTGKVWMNVAVHALCWIIVGILLVTGQLNTYAVMREYASVSNTFWTSFFQHLALCRDALLIAIILGLPTGFFCYRNKIVDNIVLVILSIVETLPIMALYALVRIPYAALLTAAPSLSELGLATFGRPIALTALVMYALYLIIFNTRAAFTNMDHSYMENAIAMGMSPSMAFFRVQLPLAIPVIFSGIRVALISCLVAASFAAYVGGGGLGNYIITGINNLSIDMQLLGVIPIFVITVIADLLMRILYDLVIYWVKGEKVL